MSSKLIPLNFITGGGNFIFNKIEGTKMILTPDGLTGIIKEDPKFKDVYLYKIPQKNGIEETYILSKLPFENTYFLIRTWGNISPDGKFRSLRCFRSDTLKCLYYAISKNCSSSIVNLLYQKDVDNETTSDWDPWEITQNRAKVYDSSIFIRNKQQLNESKLNEYKHFVILRDPIERFISLLNYIRDKNKHIAEPYLNEFREIKDRNLFISIVFSFMRGILATRTNKFSEDHFMSQKQQLFDADLSKIDDFVLQKDANKYFLTSFNVELPKNNVTKSKFFSKLDLTNESIKEIKDLWKDDFDFLEKIKTWKPE